MTGESPCGPPRVFPDQVFQAHHPAQLRQGNWLSDGEFLLILEDSWRSQYADYIGEANAQEYIHSLRREGRLYDHYEPLTIQACVNDQIVGITSLRPLAGIDLITMLEVHPQFRGSGIGSQLLDALCCASERLMAHVSIHQPRAKNFYSRQGFHLLPKACVRHGSYDLEFDVMAKTVRQPFPADRI